MVVIYLVIYLVICIKSKK